MRELFKSAYGFTPRQYILRARVQLALQLLSTTEKPTADIAYEAGFASQAHLTTMMRRHCGNTPCACRKRLRAAGISLDDPALLPRHPDIPHYTSGADAQGVPHCSGRGKTR
jgi:AraC-like DNA-binding protein